MDKHYLQDLQQQGVPVVESFFIEAGTAPNLLDLHQRLGWEKTVIKPAISGSGRHTYLLNADNLVEHELMLQELIKTEAMLLQPFQDSIMTLGESSHVVISGRYTHSMKKMAKPGEFRVQDDFGGSKALYSASEEEIRFAEQVVKACDPQPSYARVDTLIDNAGKLVVSELELIEPELWFREHQQAVELLADDILKQLHAT